MRSVVVGSLIVLALTACNRRKQPLTAEPPDWMEGKLTEMAQQRAPGAVAVSPTFKAIAYDEDEFTRWDVKLEQGYCYYFSGIGDPGVEELYLALYDQEDDEVVDDEADDPAQLVIEYCPEVSGTYRLEAKVHDGAGHYMVGVFGTSKDGTAPAPAGAPAEATAAPQPPAELPAAGGGLEGRIEKLAGASAPDADRVGDYFKGSSAKTDWYVALEKGKCYWFIGAGEDTIGKISLFLWDPNDKRLEQNPSETNEVTIGFCPEVGGMHHFQAKVEEGEGAYMVGVYAKVK